MKQKTKTIHKEVDYLTKPKAQWVSVVDKGANQTPFNVLKSLKGAKTMAKDTVKKRIKLKLVKKGAIPASVRKIVFTKNDAFPDETAVKAYLDQHGWEDYAITKKGNTFEVAGENVTDDNFKTIKSVNMGNGVTGYVGEVNMDTVDDDEADDSVQKAKGDAEDAADGADDEGAEGEDSSGKKKTTAKKAAGPEDEEEDDDAEEVRKFDAWGSYLSSENSLTGVLKDGMKDGMPPGMDVVCNSAYIAVANTLKSGMKKSKKRDTVNKIGTDFANAVLALDEVYNTLVNADNATAVEKEYIAKHEAFIQEHAKETTTKALESESAAIIAINTTLANISKTLETVAAAVVDVKKTAEEAKDSVSKVSKEVATVKSAAPTKKAAAIDVVEEGVESKTTKAAIAKEAEEEAAFEAKMVRNLMGISLMSGSRH